MSTSEEDRQDKQPAEPTKKKSHKLRWTIIILLIIFVLIPLIVVGYTGIITIPGISHIFGSHKPIDLGVEVSDEAVASGMKKTPWASIDNLPEPQDTPPIFIEREYTGSVPVTNNVTSEEFTSVLDNRLQNVPLVESVQVKFYEGGAEASFQLGSIVDEDGNEYLEFLDAPIYIKSDIVQNGNKSLSFDIQKIKLGRLPVPKKYLDQVEEVATEFINERMLEVEGFSMDRIEFKDNFVDFKGTYPETVDISE